MRLYTDFLSQPSRACSLFCRLHGLPVVEVAKRISAKEHQSEEYLRINPLGRLPFLQDGELGLPESAAILKYLMRKYKDRIPGHWYPEDPIDQATVDALLHWQHLTVRSGASRVVLAYTDSTRYAVSDHELINAKKLLFDTLETLESYYLKETPFCSIPTTHSSVGMKPSIADLLISSELDHLMLLNRFPNVDDDLKAIHQFAEFPHVKKYLQSIEQYCAPHYANVYQALRKVANPKRSKIHIVGAVQNLVHYAAGCSLVSELMSKEAQNCYTMQRVSLLFLFSCIAQVVLAGSLPIGRHLLSSPLLNEARPRFIGAYGTQVSSDGWHMLNIPKSQCEWRKDTKACFIAHADVVKILQTADTPLSNFLLDYNECYTKPNKEVCNAAVVCQWNNVSKFCELSDLGYGHESSPCYKAAPLFFKFIHQTTRCAKINNIRHCKKTAGCEWSEEVDSCVADFVYVFFGLESYSATSQAVGEEKGAQIGAALVAANKISEPGFSWGDLLDWKVPPTPCPADAQQLTCDSVDAYLSVYMPVLFYCEGKYSAPWSCASDSLCQTTPTGECYPSESVMKASSKATTDELLKSLPESSDKEFVHLAFHCDLITAKEDCSGNCVWNPRVEKCVSSEQQVAEILSKVGGDTEDALCKLLRVSSTTDCPTVFHKDKCQKKESCQWRMEACETRDEIFIEAAIEGDPALSKSYRKKVKHCARHTTKTDCSARRASPSYKTAV